MKVKVQYKNGKASLNVSFGKEDVDNLKYAADKFYEIVEGVVEFGRKVEGVLEDKVREKN